jgi:hypothetical protein
MKQNRKQKIEKVSEQKKKRGKEKASATWANPGPNYLPVAQLQPSQPRPVKETESVCFISLSLTDGWGPHVSTTFNLRLYSSLETAAVNSPFNSALIPARSFSAPRL